MTLIELDQSLPETSLREAFFVANELELALHKQTGRGNSLNYETLTEY